MAKKQQPENNSQQEGKSKINVNELLINLDKQEYGEGNEWRLIEEAQNFIHFVESEIPDKEQQERILNNIGGRITELEGKLAVGGYDRAIRRMRGELKRYIKGAITKYTQYKNNQESAMPADEIVMVAEKADKNDEAIMEENASIKQFFERSADGDQDALTQGREILSEAAEKVKIALDEFKDILKSIIDDNKEIAIDYFDGLTAEERAKILSHLSGIMGTLANKLKKSGADKDADPQYKKIKDLYQKIKNSDQQEDVKDDQGAESPVAGEAPKQETEQTNQASAQIKKEEAPKIKINKDGVIADDVIPKKPENATDANQIIIERKKIINEKTQLSLYYKVREEIQELLAKLPDGAKKEEYRTRYQKAQKSTNTLSGMRKANQQFKLLKEDLSSLISTVSTPDINMKVSPAVAEVGEIKEDFQAEFEEYKEYSGEQKRIYLENLLKRIGKSDYDDVVLRGEIEEELDETIKKIEAGDKTVGKTNNVMASPEPAAYTEKTAEDVLMEKEVEKELAKMPEKEKISLAKAIGNLGLYVECRKTGFFAKTLNTIGAERLAKKDKHIAEQGTLSRFLVSMSENYQKESERAEKRLRQKGQKGFSNYRYISSNLSMYGRTVADIAGLTATSSFRLVMAGTMFFTRGAQAAKEARLKNQEVIEKTRIDDIEKAEEEAWKLYEAAQKQGKSEITAEDLNKAFKENLPKDLLKRLNARIKSDKLFDKAKAMFAKDIEHSVFKIDKKLSEIEENGKLSAEQKEVEREKIFRKYEKFLNEMDGMISKYGTVDALALGGRYAEIAGKTVTAGLAVESLYLLYDNCPKIYHNLHNLISGGKHTHEPLNLRNQKLKSELAELRAKEMEELHKPRFVKTEEAQQRFDNEINRTAGEQNAWDAALASAQAGGVKTGGAEAAGVLPGQGVQTSAAEHFTEVQIKGKTDTFSEAIYDAAKHSDAKTQENFVHKVLGDKVGVNDSNRSELLSRSVRKLSVANLEHTDPNVKNLLYEGNRVRLKSDGSWEVLKGEGVKDARSVEEAVLRHNAARIHATERMHFAESMRGPRGGEEIHAADHMETQNDITHPGNQNENIYPINDSHFKNQYGHEFSYTLKNENGHLSAYACNEKGEIMDGVKPLNITNELPNEVEMKIQLNLHNWGIEQTNKIQELGLAIDPKHLQQYEHAGIHSFEKGGISSANHDKLIFWSRHQQEFGPEDMKRVFEISGKSGIDCCGSKENAFVETFQKMPASLKTSDSAASSYMKVFAGPEETKASGLQELLGMENAPKFQHRPSDGAVVIKDAYGHKGFDVIMSHKYIGVDGPGKGNWGIKSKFWGFGEAKPINDLTIEHVNTAKAKMAEMEEQIRILMQKKEGNPY